MSKARFVSGGLLAFLAIAPWSRGLAQQGPAMSSFYMNVKPGDGECCANVTFAQNLPPERKGPLTAVTMERTGKGRYVVLASGAAPFPTAAPRSGFFVAVTAIGSNAHCFEVATLVRGSRDLVGSIGCVDPKGAPVDSDFSWSYRADSFDFVQFTVLPRNYGYAQVFADGKLGSFFVPVKGGSVAVEKSGPGSFKVKFARLGTATPALDGKTGVALVVSNTCPEGSCGTNVCVPAASTIGGNASSVDVRCSDRTGAPIASAFRLFLGQEALNSQALGKFVDPKDYKRRHQHYNEGTNFGWVNSSEKGSTTGKEPMANPEISYLNKGKDVPGPRKIDYFHLAKGKYLVKFRDQIIYGQTYWSMHATVRETDGGAYCNIGDIDHKTTQIGVNCFDGDGVPRDARWFLGMRRLYN